MARRKSSIIPIERIASRIYQIRGERVMLDADLAELYGVPTKALNQAVTRNLERFPKDFMFQLSGEEFADLRSQIVTSSWGGRRYPPRGFTEQGVAMLASVLRSKRAVEVNIQIVRTFVHVRQLLLTSEELARTVAEHDRVITDLCEKVNWLLAPPEVEPKHPIGFQHPRSDESDD